MSFLTEFTMRRVAVTSAPRLAVSAAAAKTRPLSSTAALSKSPVETVKDGVKSVDRAVSDKIVDGIDAARAGAQKAQAAASDVASSDAAKKAQALKGDAAGKTEELKGKAAGKAEELKGKTKGAAEQVKGRV